MNIRKYLYRLRSSEYLMKRTTRNLAKLEMLTDEDKTNERFMIRMDNLYILEAIVWKSKFLNHIKKMLEESIPEFEKES